MRTSLVRKMLPTVPSMAEAAEQRGAIEDATTFHLVLGAIPVDRIVDCWPLDQFLTWLSDPASAVRR
jgi:hypothetical protein